MFSRELVVDHADVQAVTFADGVNVPLNAAALGFFIRGDYLRIDLTRPLRLPGTRWTNYVWAGRERGDPWPVPLRHRQVRPHGFPNTRAEADKVLRQFGR